MAPGNPVKMKVDVYEREGSVRLALPDSGSIERDRALFPIAPTTPLFSISVIATEQELLFIGALDQVTPFFIGGGFRVTPDSTT